MAPCGAIRTGPSIPLAGDSAAPCSVSGTTRVRYTAALAQACGSKAPSSGASLML